jgi:L-erythro-3,5-diaminohexanoate dehydrogenase
MELGDPLGLHRVVPEGDDQAPLPLPQRATRLDNDPTKRFASEIHVEVATLNIDAASFRQMEEEAGSADGVGPIVQRTVDRRGKQHNPVTGSGGMLLGRVSWVGEAVADRVAVGQRIATLASLSLTPLHVERVVAIRPASAQVDVVGTAVVFATAPFAVMPPNMNERLVLAVLDVAGAAPQVARLVNPGHTVVVLGAGGKSGILCCAEARRRLGKSGKLIGIESHAPYAKELTSLGLCDVVVQEDARDVVGVRDRIAELTLGEAADVTFSCVNTPGCEMAAILSTKDRGKVYFFAMSTSFTACALGAEGVGADVDLLIGNGFAEGHAEHTLALVREDNRLRSLFERRYT